MRYRHAYADAQYPLGNLGKRKIGGLLDVRVVVDPGDYRGKHRNCTCPPHDPVGGLSPNDIYDSRKDRWYRLNQTGGCPSHGDASDEMA